MLLEIVGTIIHDPIGVAFFMVIYDNMITRSNQDRFGLEF